MGNEGARVGDYFMGRLSFLREVGESEAFLALEGCESALLAVESS